MDHDEQDRKLSLDELEGVAGGADETVSKEKPKRLQGIQIEIWDGPVCVAGGSGCNTKID